MARARLGRNPAAARATAKALGCLLIGWVATSSAFADVLVGINGERFVGKVIEESADTVVFESETAGRLVVPRNRIRELQRPVPAPPVKTNQMPAAVATAALVTNATVLATNVVWRPPSIGKDGSDWLQLKSDEWLKGRLYYVQDKKVSFYSDKLEDLTLDLKDVRYLFPARPMFAKFDNQEQVFGTVTLSNNVVDVVGPEQVQVPRDQLTGITPGGEREIDFWSAKAILGFNFQSGNTKQATLNASAELARRTPATQFLMTYLGNFSEVDGSENANNHRINISYDVRLNRNWFFRPVQLEYYRDQLANIAHRVTAGVGIGYYIFDREGLEWKVAAGPGYQYTRFETVEAGQSDYASTPAGILQSGFKADITRRLTFKETYAGVLASEQAGLYSHHLISTFEFEIKRTLELDLSFVWDYLQNPQVEASGVVPRQTDLRLTLGIGMKFP
jgi:hypothetical protein